MADFRCILNPTINGELLYCEKSINPSCSEHIHLGGLFNSFYPYDWFKITGASSFKVKIHGSPEHSKITIFLHAPDATPIIIAELNTTSLHNDVELEIKNVCPLPGQRLTCQIECNGHIDLKSVSWRAVSREQRKVKLGVVICNHKNEANVKKNIEQLVASRSWEEEQPVVILVNNGAAMDESWFPRERFYKFDQENLGGSGGFGRGIYEIVYGSVNSLGVTHVLLMDDDVLFYPEVISRAIAFHSKSHRPVIIGGAMLKLEDPTWLHETGSYVKSTHRIGTATDIPAGPLAETGALDFLGRAVEYDYNAWWFCSFPIDAVRTVGLPLPVFIHGDDIDYGIRLKSHGYSIYCPGGIAIWHQCFENKHLTWIRYFDFRNALIRLTLCFDNTPKILIRQLKHVCKRAVIRNDYGAYIMALKAFEDFCRGPDILLEKDFESLVTRLDHLYHQYSHAESTGRYKLADTVLRPQKTNNISRLLKYLTTNMHATPVPSFRHFETENSRFHWADVPCFSDITVSLKNGEKVHYRRDLKKYKILKKRLQIAVRTPTAELGRVMSAWQGIRETLHSEDFWKRYTKPSMDA